MKTKLSMWLLALTIGFLIGFSSCTRDTELKPVEKEKTVTVNQ